MRPRTIGLTSRVLRVLRGRGFVTFPIPKGLPERVLRSRIYTTAAHLGLRVSVRNMGAALLVEHKGDA